MKIIVGTIFVLLVFAQISCQQAVDIEKEKEAIMAVLHEEGEAALAKDMERMFALHVQDETETRLEMGQYGHTRYNGWEEVKGLLGDYLGGEGELGGDNPVNTRDNVVIKVNGNTAWLVCDNMWEWTVDGVKDGYSNVQITFLEKIQGEWKISFAAYYNLPMPE